MNKLPCNVSIKSYRSGYRVVIENWKLEASMRKSIAELMNGEKASFSGRGARDEAARFKAKLIAQLKLVYLSQGIAVQTVWQILAAYAAKRNVLHYREQLRSFERCRNLLEVDVLQVNFPILIESCFPHLVTASKRNRTHMNSELNFLRTAVKYYKRIHNRAFEEPDWGFILKEWGKPQKRRVNRDDIRKAFTVDELKLILEEIGKPTVTKTGKVLRNTNLLFYYAFLLQVIYGLRISEVFALEFKNFDKSANTLTITGIMKWRDENGKLCKEKVARIKQFGEIDPELSPLVRPLTKSVLSIVDSIRAEHRKLGFCTSFLFVNLAGKVPDYNRVYEVFRGAVKKLIEQGKIRPSALQTFTATHAVRKTANTWGPILADSSDYDAIRTEFLSHADSKINSASYVDHYLDGMNSRVPAALAATFA